MASSMSRHRVETALLLKKSDLIPFYWMATRLDSCPGARTIVVLVTTIRGLGSRFFLFGELKIGAN